MPASPDAKQLSRRCANPTPPAPDLARVTTDRLAGPDRHVRSPAVLVGKDHPRLVFAAEGSLPIHVTSRGGHAVSLDEQPLPRSSASTP